MLAKSSRVSSTLRGAMPVKSCHIPASLITTFAAWRRDTKAPTIVHAGKAG